MGSSAGLISVLKDRSCSMMVLVKNANHLPEQATIKPNAFPKLVTKDQSSLKMAPANSVDLTQGLVYHQTNKVGRLAERTYAMNDRRC